MSACMSLFLFRCASIRKYACVSMCVPHAELFSTHSIHCVLSNANVTFQCIGAITEPTFGFSDIYNETISIVHVEMLFILLGYPDFIPFRSIFKATIKTEFKVLHFSCMLNERIYPNRFLMTIHFKSPYWLMLLCTMYIQYTFSTAVVVVMFLLLLYFAITFSCCRSMYTRFVEVRVFEPASLVRFSEAYRR